MKGLRALNVSSVDFCSILEKRVYLGHPIHTDNPTETHHGHGYIPFQISLKTLSLSYFLIPLRSSYVNKFAGFSDLKK